MILTPPMAKLPLTILALFFEASVSTPSFVVVQVYLSSSCFLRPIHCLAPFAQRLLMWGVRLYQIRPRIVRLDAASWGLRLIAWIHHVLGAVAVIPWNPNNRLLLPILHLLSLV